jgi:hypothetical protein
MTDKNDGDYFCFDCGALINDVNTEFVDGEPFCVDCTSERKPKTGPKNDGDQAFPTGDHIHGGHAGMSLRDWFAGQALAGILASYPPNEKIDVSIVAMWSYDLADAMIAEREK